MADSPIERRLVAILAADVAGYSILVGQDEQGTVISVREIRDQIIEPKIVEHQGRLFKTMGDGFLAEFSSVVNAVACAVAMQKTLADRNVSASTSRRVELRIGLHLGDVIAEGNDLYGDGVNIAARIESLAIPGGITASAMVRDNIGNRLDLSFDDLGEQQLKNISKPVRVFRIGGPPSQRNTSTATDSIKPTIAVLPFMNMSGDPEQEYFSDGMTEDVITDLSKVSALHVTSRNTAFSFKGRSVKVSQIASDLGVRYVVEGSVRKSGGTLRITAQLIDAMRDEHIWAERYDRDLTDVFALQDEISAAIVSALRVKLLPEEKRAIESRSTLDAKAYELYLMGRHYFMLRGARNYEIALRFALRSLEIDREYARAWCLTALCQSYLHLGGQSSDSGFTAANTACRLDPSLADAHAALGRVLAEMGRLDEAVISHKISLQLDPDSFDVRHNMGLTCLELGHYLDSVEHLERAASLVQTDHTSLNLMALALRSLGRQEEYTKTTLLALQRIEAEVLVRPDNSNAIAHGALALARLGHRERAREWISRALIIDPEDANNLYNLACAFAQIDDVSEALELLERCVPQMPPEFTSWLEKDLDLEKLRDHPRLLTLSRSHGTQSARPLHEQPLPIAVHPSVDT